MSIPSNADNSVEEEISDMSFVRNEGNSNVNKEPVFTFVPIKEEKSNILSENNIDLKSELYEIKQECVLHEHVKEDISFRSYGVNLKESQEDPLATNCSDIENNMKEYPSIGHIKEEMNTEIQEEHEDIDECKLESPFANDDMNTNIYEENTPGSDSDGRDTASVKDIF